MEPSAILPRAPARACDLLLILLLLLLPFGIFSEASHLTLSESELHADAEDHAKMAMVVLGRGHGSWSSELLGFAVVDDDEIVESGGGSIFSG